MRRTAITAIILGVIAAVICVIVGQPFVVTGLAVGLGLALVAEHARAHHGSVRVEPAPGGGARFVVSLPAVEP